ncbi:hypothetical protein ANTQUA_LOCUS7911 [Anthophora quadrimaculata]
MALKKRTTRSKGEQLYMLEVFVDRVHFNPDVTSVSVEDLIVSVRFHDLPVYQINVPPIKEANDQENEQTGNSNNSKFGKSCLFAKTPSSLIKAIRWSSLTLELYDKTSTCSSENPAILGSAKIILPACMCKHVIAAQNQIDGESTPCTVKDTFPLADFNGKVTGNVTVILRLSCYGTSIVKHFSLEGKSFMLEDSPLQKFLCPQLPLDNLNDDKNDSKDEGGPSKPSLKRPDSPPRISMDDPAFQTLTTAEKLNDPKYRELVYIAYPNEQTCSCIPTNRSTHPLECRSGCTRPCCMKLRNPNILSTQQERRVEDTLADTYCVNNFLSALYALKQDSPCNKPTRLKGGGDIEQIYLSSVPNTNGCYRWTDYDADYTWYEDKNNMERRLEGGGGEQGMSSCSCSGSPVPVPPGGKSAPREGDVIPIFDACTPRMTSTGAKPGCVCPGKDAKFPRGGAKCMKSPCMGIDCLIRAFKDAQEFVDSIGRVPGLPGLGLMDPSESPYFGRDLDRDYVDVVEPQEEKKKGQQQGATQATAPTCTAPCSMQISKLDDTRPPVSPYSPPLSRGVTVPPRLGIVREAIPVLPEVGSALASTKHRKKEEKKEEKTDKKELDGTSPTVTEAEMGPCGEPKCKSRRRKPPDSESLHQIASQVSSKPRAGTKKTAAAPKGRRKSPKISKGAGSKRGPKGSARGNQSGAQKSQQAASDKSKDKPVGPGGDRSTVSQPAVPVSKRIMRYVYFVGDFYPGINFGHRDCIDVGLRVPANMGWLWNTVSTAGNFKPPIGWKPGAIGRYLYEMLQDAKEISYLEEEEDKEYDRGKGGKEGDRGKGKAAVAKGKALTDRGGRAIGRGKPGERPKSAPSRQKSPASRRTGRAMSYQGMQKQLNAEEEEGMEAPPTLHIHRKDGTYYVTMYPIRQEQTTEARLAEPMKPLQFKIVKNKDDASVASSSTASDMEIEFSPPAAVSRIRKKPDVVHVETQVRQQEIIDAYKAEELKKKNRRGRREKRLRKSSKTSVRK